MSGSSACKLCSAFLDCPADDVRRYIEALSAELNKRPDNEVKDVMTLDFCRPCFEEVNKQKSSPPTSPPAFFPDQRITIAPM